jgi:hypothetical protein
MAIICRDRRAFLAFASILVLTLTACEQAREKNSAQSTTQSTTTVADAFLITADSIGPAILGTAPSALSARLKIIRDTLEIVFEDMTDSVLVLGFSGDTIRAGIDSGRINRLTVTSPRFRTADSISVGTPITRFLSEPGVYVWASEGQATLWSPSHCGMGFRLFDGTNPYPPAGLGDSADSLGVARLRELPKTTQVGEISVYGCKQSR